MVTERRCEQRWQVDALREGRLGPQDAESFERHRRTCPECAQRFAEDERLARLGRELEHVVPDEVAVRRRRSLLLHDAARASRTLERPGRAWALASAAVLAAAVGIAFGALHWSTRSTTAASVTTPRVVTAHYASEITPSAGARYIRARVGSVERVRLEAGMIRVHVRHQTPDERFFVELPDGTLEVRGTTFTVAVEGGVTSQVAVSEGFVALRVGGEPERVLHEQERWEHVIEPSAGPASALARPDDEAARGKLAAPDAAANRKPREAPDAAAYAAYERVMELYRSGHYGAAAAGFRDFASRYPRATEAEDAAFLEAAALARAGRSDAAALVAEQFLENYPKGSFHTRDALMLVVRGARDRGDCEKAQHVVARWASTEQASEWKTALGRCAPARSAGERAQPHRAAPTPPQR